jgi:hypothetical protein
MLVGVKSGNGVKLVVGMAAVFAVAMVAVRYFGAGRSRKTMAVNAPALSWRFWPGQRSADTNARFTNAKLHHANLRMADDDGQEARSPGVAAIIDRDAGPARTSEA